MAKPYDPELVEQGTLRPLPYRPTFKLKRTKERPYGMYGFLTVTFEDERGNLYQRERDGEWERWTLILERKTRRGRLLYRADTSKLEPDDHGDCLDRIDDFGFAVSAIFGLIENAKQRGLFPKEQLESMKRVAKELLENTSSLTPAIVEPSRNGHA
jgi:hypothetical protein